MPFKFLQLLSLDDCLINCCLQYTEEFVVIIRVHILNLYLILAVSFLVGVFSLNNAYIRAKLDGDVQQGLKLIFVFAYNLVNIH